ncbi:hypothetical protein [Olsenella uli]|uniref:hypothetical protein n=1 Tax=Olsenella uli TaxID=133926 RepID=UPI00325FDE1E
MRVAPGTNVILSGAILAYPTIGAALDDMAKHHELALSTYVIEGLREVVARKWPARAHALEGLLQSLTYELVMTPLEPKGGIFDIRGPKGYPVPCSAMLAAAPMATGVRPASSGVPGSRFGTRESQAA